MLYLHGLSDYPLAEVFDDTLDALPPQQTQFIYGLGGLIATQRAGQLNFIFRDHLGSTRVVVSSDGTSGIGYAYDALGNVVGTRRFGSASDLAYRYTGQEFDGETGLHNFRARLYDSELFRFYATDPADEQHSPYAFVGNSPLMFRDPTGKWFFSAIIPVLGTIIDAGLWSATINAGIQLGMIATGNQQGFNVASLVGSFVGGAVGAGLGILAPDFSQLVALPAKYALKAGYAGLTGFTSGFAGSVTTDLLDGGDFDIGRSLKAGAWGAGIAGAISLGYSAYDYFDWDRLSIDEKIQKLNAEFSIEISLKLTDVGYGEYNSITNQIKLSDRALSTKNIAREVIDHEMVHKSRRITDNLLRMEAGFDEIERGALLYDIKFRQYQRLVESPAYLKNLSQLPYANVPSRFVNDIVNSAERYLGPVSSPLRLKHVWFNLFR